MRTGLVVAPYATMLALGVDPAAAIKNLRWMTKKGWFGAYGFYESADFTLRTCATHGVSVMHWCVRG